VIPPGRLGGQPEDIVRVVPFLAGRGGAWVNGQLIRADRRDDLAAPGSAGHEEALL
jgi:NAD(P)-dependent dehydrogenase (short-subunit alcohol dehydrogenase family)